ncbi:MAG: cob(I)yrinic acid a,c-diamide adenosyltransferase [Candidatus Aenigmarchaeota archaeon]|nr:cob(I)yrinic acid a,c-diamide adenosyltransferase [Candidatus Aenigmarchaeota archaeon]MCK5332929.1 cob(I)yrinic acid a,c-diamide adenosyltransferase [Candidatus Aenigmarchaeota archaeon]
MNGYGKVHVIYGYGAGKTSASVGRAIRAAGAGLNVVYVSFMKGGESSEVKLLREIPKIDYYCPGAHDFIPEGGIPTKSQVEHAMMALNYAESCSDKKENEWYDLYYDKKVNSKDDLCNNNEPNMLICDEILTAAFWNVIELKQVVGLIRGKRNDLELIMTGHFCPPEIQCCADYASEINNIKHPYEECGLQARRGIEF